MAISTYDDSNNLQDVLNKAMQKENDGGLNTVIMTKMQIAAIVLANKYPSIQDMLRDMIDRGGDEEPNATKEDGTYFSMQELMDIVKDAEWTKKYGMMATTATRVANPWPSGSATQAMYQQQLQQAQMVQSKQQLANDISEKLPITAEEKKTWLEGLKREISTLFQKWM